MSNNKFSILFILLLSFIASAQEKKEVFFGFNEDKPTKQATEELISWIKTHQDIQLNKLSGYCDSLDSNSYNADLSLRRIQSVLGILKQYNKSKDIQLEPIGEDFKQSAIQSQNRKVVITYTIPENPKKVNKAGIDKPVYSRKTTAKQAVINPGEIVSAEKGVIATTPLEQQFKKAKVGDLIKLQNINFHLNSEEVMKESEGVLLELLQVLIDNPKLKIEIQGHICCNPDPNDTKLSFRRARYILRWLTNNDININRLSFIGFGSSRPIYPIPEKSYAEEVANRRVEILVVQKE